MWFVGNAILTAKLVPACTWLINWAGLSCVSTARRLSSFLLIATSTPAASNSSVCDPEMYRFGLVLRYSTLETLSCPTHGHALSEKCLFLREHLCMGISGEFQSVKYNQLPLSCFFRICVRYLGSEDIHETCSSRNELERKRKPDDGGQGCRFNLELSSAE